MKKIAFGVLMAMVLFLSVPISGYAGKYAGKKAGKKTVFVGAKYQVGHTVRWGHPVRSRPYVRWRYSPRRPRYYWGGWGGVVVLKPWYPYGYYAAPPVVIQQQPPVYVEPEQQQSGYWYYCQESQTYYPYVKSCPGGWMKVVPEATPPTETEDMTK